MHRSWPILAITAIGALTHCSSKSAPSSVTSDDSCQPGHDLTGASTDVASSRFAFGGTPTESDEGANKRWSGPEGEMLIMPFGETASASSGAASAAKPDWSNDPLALSQHVNDYFVSRGIAHCQIEGAQILGGSLGRIIVIRRAIDGILVDSSTANARMNVDDQTSEETITWPTIPAQVVADARAFREQLKDAVAFVTYQGKLPPSARSSMGTVRILHSAPSGVTLKTKVVWATSGPPSTYYFDTDATPVNPTDL